AGQGPRWRAAGDEPPGARHLRARLHSLGSAGGRMIRVLLVDDHPVVREGLAAVLEDTKDVRVVGALGSAEEALVSVAAGPPDVVLLDLELPGMNGVDAIPRLTAAAPKSRIIVLTAYDTEERVLGALKAGAAGYLLKGAGAAEIVQAIRAVAAGGSYLTP